jgi:predicted permease
MVGSALAGSLVLGSIVMWLGIPAGWLWLFSTTGDDYFRVYLETLIATPPTMAAWGWCLHRINRVYLSTGRRSDLLATAMTLSVILAIVGLAMWVVFLGGPHNHPAQGAW